MFLISPPVMEQTLLSPKGLFHPLMVSKQRLNSVIVVARASGESDSCTRPSGHPGSRVIRIDIGARGLSGRYPYEMICGDGSPAARATWVVRTSSSRVPSDRLSTSPKGSATIRQLKGIPNQRQ